MRNKPFNVRLTAFYVSYCFSISTKNLHLLYVCVKGTCHSRNNSVLLGTPRGRGTSSHPRVSIYQFPHFPPGKSAETRLTGGFYTTFERAAIIIFLANEVALVQRHDRRRWPRKIIRKIMSWHPFKTRRFHFKCYRDIRQLL